MIEKFIEYAFVGEKPNRVLKIEDQSIEVPETEVVSAWRVACVSYWRGSSWRACRRCRGPRPG